MLVRVEVDFMILKSRFLFLIIYKFKFNNLFLLFEYYVESNDAQEDSVWKKCCKRI